MPSLAIPTLHLFKKKIFEQMADHLGHSTDEVTLVSTEEKKSESLKLEFSEDEETLIARMFSLLGERWSLIAGRIPGRTAEEIEKYWNSTHSSRE